MDRDTDDMWRHPDHHLTDDLSWRTDQPVAISASFSSNTSASWLTSGPGAFDIDHDATARLIETNGGISACTFDDFNYIKLADSVPMGYSNLYVLEKRAVVVAGRVQRIWPRKFDIQESVTYGPRGLGDVFRAIVAVRSWGCRHLRLGLGAVLWRAIGEAVTLSEQMNGAAILVTRVLQEEYWH